MSGKASRWPQWDKRAKGAVADFSFSLLQDEVEEAKKQKTEKNGSSNGKAVEVENGAEEEEEDGEEEEDLVEGEDEAEGEEEEDLVEGEDDEGEGKDILKIFKNQTFTKYIFFSFFAEEEDGEGEEEEEGDE